MCFPIKLQSLFRSCGSVHQVERHKVSTVTNQKMQIFQRKETLVHFVRTICKLASMWLGGQWLGHWTYDQQVAGSNPGLPAAECNPGRRRRFRIDTEVHCIGAHPPFWLLELARVKPNYYYYRVLRAN